ncbi:MAG TPA: hypothetical protein VGP93_05125, partial [Polyangiaceae bacterium]|nr:hypothetical protein [Polyangiaceae bacterium]
MASFANLGTPRALSRLWSSLRPPPGSAGARRLARLRWRLGFLALFAAVAALYTFYVSAGLPRWPVYGTYLDLQADGFLKGQLSLPLTPAPELLRAKDPYDPVNLPYWMLDASYYKGKFYIYWGPVPALFDAAAKWLLRVRWSVGDQYIVLAFLCFAYLCGAVLIVRMARRLFPAVPRALVVVGALVFACANPTLHAAATASTYHAAIIAAQSWLLAGLVFAFDAVWYADTARARGLTLLAAGVCWGLAIGCRVTVLPAVALLIAITAVLKALARPRWLERALASALWLGVPVAVAGIALLAYNKARFDDWLEFGTKVQLSGYPLFRVDHEFVAPNLYSYLFRPWHGSCQFPYVLEEWQSSDWVPRFLRPLPAGYVSPEPLVGFLAGVPLAWLAPVAFVLAPRPWRALTQRTRAYLFCLLSFAVCASVTGFVGLGLYLSTMRYLSDITYGVVLLSLFGAFALYARLHALRVAHAAAWLV